MKRRTFLRVLGCGTAAATATGLSANIRTRAGKASVTPRGSARNIILVNLVGGISHVDTFDLKVSLWTPDDFAPTTSGNLLMPAGLFPKLMAHTDKFSLLRALSGFEQVHQRAQYVVETGQTFNPTFAKEHPHVGSIMAYELEAARRENDLLPTFLAVNARVQGPGLLSSAYAAFPIDGNDGVPGLIHPDGEAVFRQRYEALQRLDKDRQSSSKGSAVSDYGSFYDAAERLMYQRDLEGVFELDDATADRYGETGVGVGCALAFQTISRDKGTRIVQVNHGSWDHHYDIYVSDAQGGLYQRASELDGALAALFSDLAETPGTRGGTLLDETLVLVTGEFGRTPGDLSRNYGRDHYPYAYAALVAGGGIVGGQNFGTTDPEGWSITDQFWSKDRYMTGNDMVATLYSSLGIDWTKEIADTPSGRVYEYTPKYNGVAGYYTDIVEMFR